MDHRLCPHRGAEAAHGAHGPRRSTGLAPRPHASAVPEGAQTPWKGHQCRGCDVPVPVLEGRRRPHPGTLPTPRRRRTRTRRPAPCPFAERTSPTGNSAPRTAYRSSSWFTWPGCWTTGTRASSTDSPNVVRSSPPTTAERADRAAPHPTRSRRWPATPCCSSGLSGSTRSICSACRWAALPRRSSRRKSRTSSARSSSPAPDPPGVPASTRSRHSPSRPRSRAPSPVRTPRSSSSSPTPQAAGRPDASSWNG